MKKCIAILLGLLLAAAPAAAEIVGSAANGDYIHRYAAPDGQEIYFVSFLEEPEVFEQDVNFDGEPDLVALTAYGTSNTYYEFFVKGDDGYTRAPHPGNDAGLINYSLDEKNQFVETYANNGFAGLLHERCLYRWEDGQLRPLRRLVADMLETWETEGSVMTHTIHDDQVRLCVYGYADGDDVLWEATFPVDDVPEDLFEQADKAFYGGL